MTSNEAKELIVTLALESTTSTNPWYARAVTNTVIYGQIYTTGELPTKEEKLAACTKQLLWYQATLKEITDVPVIPEEAHAKELAYIQGKIQILAREMQTLKHKGRAK